MKNGLYLLLIAVASACQLLAQSSGTEKSEVIKKEITLDNVNEGKLYIRNIFGSLDIQGYDGNKIILEVKKSLKVKSASKLEATWAETDLGVVQKGNAVLFYPKSPCTNPAISEVSPEDWDKHNQLYLNNCQWKYDGEVKYDYVVKVPKSLMLSVATINNGNIIIKDVNAKMWVNNINGGIKLENIGGATEARTINGDVDLKYVSNPNEDSYYYTLNGNINANFKKGLASNLYFKSYNGDFYTELEDNILQTLPVDIEKASENKGVKYKVGGRAGVKVRQGGPRLDFETFNGNVYVTEQ
ncbi:MAG: hypothetical protein ACK4TA_06445 [Saprospiraceae bacterium]